MKTFASPNSYIVLVNFFHPLEHTFIDKDYMSKKGCVHFKICYALTSKLGTNFKVRFLKLLNIPESVRKQVKSISNNFLY